MTKTYDITLDIEKELYSPSNLLFSISDFDLSSVQLNLQITQDGSPIDLAGSTVEIAIKKPSGLTVYQNCTVGPVKGIANVTLSNQSYIEFGIYTAEVYVRKNEEISVTSPFWYQSRYSVLSDIDVSTNDWSALQQLIFSYDKKPIITSGFPTADPEYVGQMAFDSVNKTAYIANGLSAISWQLIGTGEGGGANDDILGLVPPTTVTPTRIGQLYIDTVGKAAYIATGATAADWEQIDGASLPSVSWTDILDKPTTFTPSTHNHLWADITDKPTTFTPSTHSHLWADITDKPTTFAPTDHDHLWADISDKPSTFAPSAHNHPISEITNLQTTLDAKSDDGHSHTWTEITGKPTTFTPETHNHSWVDIIDKPTTFAPETHNHLWADITDKPTTFAPSDHDHLWADITDKPTVFPPETHTHDEYLTEAEADLLYTKFPSTGAADPVGAPLYVGQIYVNTTSKEAFIANSMAGDWQSISMDELGGGAGSVDWTAITNKPNTFTPSTHTHLWADITDKPTTFAPSDHDHLWADITDKPTVFPPDVHSHTYDSITDKPLAFPPTLHNHVWADITDKPTTFDPSIHNHAISDITGLQTALDGKSDDGHTHLWADITDKPTTFAPETHNHLWADITDKPTTFTPSTHSHEIAEITGLQTALDAKSDDGHTHLWADITDKPTTFTPSTHTHLWADITDKPTTFAPETHNHAITDITGLQTALDGKVDDSEMATKANVDHDHLWADITDKPTTFTPSTHTHLWADITDKPTTFTPSTHTHLWADITDKPTTFTPSAHGHEISEITGLQTALDGKVAQTYVDTQDDEIKNTILSGLSLWKGTQAAYDALTPDANTLYFITG